MLELQHRLTVLILPAFLLKAVILFGYLLTVSAVVLPQLVLLLLLQEHLTSTELHYYPLQHGHLQLSSYHQHKLRVYQLIRLSLLIHRQVILVILELTILPMFIKLIPIKLLWLPPVELLLQ